MGMGMPRVVRVRQNFNSAKVTDIERAVRDEFSRLGLRDAVRVGRRVGITVGSRGINGITEILRALVSEVRSCGGAPVLLAAMGSHGGGTADGQGGVLRSLGIDEGSMGAPVVTCAECVRIGVTRGGYAAYVLSSALSVDSILVVNRVKVHTAFHGTVESGLYKMLAVGLGGPMGASQFHARGASELPGMLLEIGEAILAGLPVAAGFAIVENAREETAAIRGVLPRDFRREEPELLELARSLMPSLPVNGLDV
ncbi:MAG: DUF362 domain-containing protein [Synergistaceae bacterium]|nr:DUF362 domain-containing protein [Synergistaceae bacterium]